MDIIPEILRFLECLEVFLSIVNYLSTLICPLLLMSCFNSPPPFNMGLAEHRAQLKLIKESVSSSGKPLNCFPNSHKSLLASFLYSGRGALRSSMEHGARGVNLSYRLYDPSSKVVQEGGRSLIPVPYETTYLRRSAEPQKIPVTIRCPNVPGTYRLVIDMVQEGVAWMHLLPGQKNWIDETLVVAAPKDIGDSENKRQSIEEKLLNLAGADIAKPIAEAYKIAKSILETSYFPLYDPELGTSYPVSNAGSQYPMVWTRDMAMIQRAQPYLDISAPSARHWSELFYHRLSEKTGIEDWVAYERASIKHDKNDILSDQELWTAIAALEAIDRGILAKSWLKEPIVGTSDDRPAKDHLLQSIDILLKNRWDAANECLWTGHVADWGDVGMKGRDSTDSTKMHGPRVCSMFSQALLYQATGLILKYGLLGSGDAAKFPRLQSVGGMKGIMASIEKFAETRLWMERAGFYRVHFHIDALAHSFDESSMFALGGHVVGLESGLIKGAARDSVLREILKRQEQYQLSTISGNLIPPYPGGTFENPIMDEEWEYQNGGQWDWYGPRAATQIYRWNPSVGIAKFSEVARKVVKNGSFYEWEKKDGSPGAGIHYRASAAAFLWSLESGPLKGVAEIGSRNPKERLLE